MSFAVSKPCYAAACRQLLQRTNFESMSWRHHALGMLQAEYDETLRVHIWHPDLVTISHQDDRSIHDHRFDLLSYVAAGRIFDQSVSVQYVSGGDKDSVEVWGIDHAKAQAEKGDVGSALMGRALVVNHGIVVREPGEVYFIQRGDFHRTAVNEPAVTVVFRDKFGSSPARVLGHGRSGIVKDTGPGLLQKCFVDARDALRRLGWYDVLGRGIEIVDAPGDRCGNTRKLPGGDPCPGCRACG